jgi:hypothetical protein
MLQAPDFATQSGYAHAAQELLNEQLRNFWMGVRNDVEEASMDPAEYKNQQLPLARIKKVQPKSFKFPADFAVRPLARLHHKASS